MTILGPIEKWMHRFIPASHAVIRPLLGSFQSENAKFYSPEEMANHLKQALTDSPILMNYSTMQAFTGYPVRLIIPHLEYYGYPEFSLNSINLTIGDGGTFPMLMIGRDGADLVREAQELTHIATGIPGGRSDGMLMPVHRDKPAEPEPLTHSRLIYMLDHSKSTVKNFRENYDETTPKNASGFVRLLEQSLDTEDAMYLPKSFFDDKPFKMMEVHKRIFSNRRSPICSVTMTMVYPASDDPSKPKLEVNEEFSLVLAGSEDAMLYATRVLDQAVKSGEFS